MHDQVERLRAELEEALAENAALNGLPHGGLNEEWKYNWLNSHWERRGPGLTMRCWRNWGRERRCPLGPHPFGNCRSCYTVDKYEYRFETALDVVGPNGELLDRTFHGGFALSMRNAMRKATSAVALAEKP